MKYTFEIKDENYLAHFGIKGMKWRKRRAGRKKFAARKNEEATRTGYRSNITEDDVFEYTNRGTGEKTTVSLRDFKDFRGTPGTSVKIKKNGQDYASYRTPRSKQFLKKDMIKNNATLRDRAEYKIKEITSKLKKKKK